MSTGEWYEAMEATDAMEAMEAMGADLVAASDVE